MPTEYLQILQKLRKSQPAAAALGADFQEKLAAGQGPAEAWAAVDGLRRAADDGVPIISTGSFTLAGPKQRHRDRRERRRATEPVRPGKAASRAPALAFVAMLLLTSGCCALVFQVAWMRELRLVFGNTTAAAAAVLAIFMGGLGAGSAVLGKRADQVERPLLMYGLLETAVAISVAASVWLVGLARWAYLELGGQESLGLSGATLVRLALAVAVMGVPTFLMGGTLPAAVRSVTAAADLRRLALAVLYGANTLGAVCGAAIATFFALEQLGTRATLWAGCAVNLSVGLIAYSRGRQLPPLERSVPVHQESIHDSGPSAFSLDTTTISGAGLAYVTAAVLGFTFFALELVWFRMLAPILGGTTFTFGLILCVALFGIGVGGAAYNVVFRWIRPSWSALAITCAAEGALAALPYALGDRVALLAGRLAEQAQSFPQLVLGWSYVAAIVVLPVALVSGLQFPLLVALLGQGRQDVSKQLGLAYAWNTLGAIAGSLVVGFGALPLLTAPGTWQAMVLLLLALAGLIVAGAPGRRGWSAAGVGALALFAIGCLWQTGPTAVWRHSGIGAGRAMLPPPDPNSTRFWSHAKRGGVVWEAEGIEAGIGIIAGDGISFVVNGKVDGSAVGDAPTQVGAAIVAAALHPAPRKSLVIGLGTGQTAGWLAEMPGVEHVDVVELEPAIDEMARRLSRMNHDVLHHPRIRRIYRDGREFVFTTRDTYDLLISEPSNPFRAGVATLYTVEFYDGARRRLNEGGLFLQWMQAYEVNEEAVETVLATVGSVFEHVEVWQTMPGDLLLVCSPTPLEYSAAELRERVGRGTFRDALRLAWQTEDFEGFLARFVAGARFVEEVARLSTLRRNTDDQTVLEYGFAKTVGRDIRFSTEHLRQAARQGGWHRPALVDASTEGAVDWEKMEIRRQELNLVLRGDFATGDDLGPYHRALVNAFYHYRRGNYAEVIQEWPLDARDAIGDVSRLALARCYAEQGDGQCLVLIAEDGLEERCAIEATAVRAIYFWRSGQTADALESIETICRSLNENPWPVFDGVPAALDAAPELTAGDPVEGRRFYDLLAHPWTAHRMEPQRLIVRYLIAERLGNDEVVEALSAWEPHIPWVDDLLQRRAEVYAETNHPLAERARRDWAWYQRHSP